LNCPYSCNDSFNSAVLLPPFFRFIACNRFILSIINSGQLELTAVEFKLPQLLVEHSVRIFNRQQIMEKIYHEEGFASDRTVV
jgi:DNA-binding response OmpR family regulator